MALYRNPSYLTSNYSCSFECVTKLYILKVLILNAVIGPSFKRFILQPTELTISINVFRLRLTSFRFTEIGNLQATKEAETVT